MPGHDIFVSYASQDRDRIRPLVRGLEEAGWSVFWDVAGLHAGDNWRQRLEEEASSSRSMVVVWSKASVKSDWVSDEAQKGKQRKVLVPVRIDDVEPPLGFGTIHYRDLVGWDGTASAPPFRRLLEDLGKIIGPPPAVEEKPGEGEGRGGGGPSPGTAFRDGDSCPEMVVIPAGLFLMGSLEHERGHAPGEGPRHQVAIARPFAVGKYPVTFDEWDACAAAGGCTHSPGAPWGRGRQPVTEVSWRDAQQYVSWLSRRTGEAYRLLSEAEWEYAARAGATTRYPWGDEPAGDRANFWGSRWSGSGRGTAPVGSFPANAFGLHDTIGNVWEWVQDCWNAGYELAPADGSAWEVAGERGSLRVLRGGSWAHEPGATRAATRYPQEAGLRRDDVGFRVARTLAPPGR